MIKKESHTIFTEFLKSGKHRITPERFEVLDAALEQRGHFGADELYVSMKLNKSNISRATVYNTLELLAQCGLLAKRNFGDGKTNYESSYNRINHGHLICTHCGQIIEFSSPKIQKFVYEVCKELGFKPDGYSFNIFGKCDHKDSCNNYIGEKD